MTDICIHNMQALNQSDIIKNKSSAEMHVQQNNKG